MIWIPQSDDQFFLWDWSIRNGAQMDLGFDINGIATINGLSPASPHLHLLVKELKKAT